MTLAPQSAAAGYRLKVLHYFCTIGITRCPKEIIPGSGLIMDAEGNLFGETGDGGVRCRGIGCGTVFELSPDNTAASSWALTVLYRFCPNGEPCADGAQPYRDLIMDAAGNLYGRWPRAP
jgi:hypothetical protein